MSEVSRETLISNFFPERTDEISRYAELLATVGIERGLIGPKEGDRIWDRHIANSIPVATLIPEGASVIDIGSGAGLPGIVLALHRPDIKVTLLEPLQRRVDFLQEVVAELDLPISIIRGRAESVKGNFDIVTARAVAPLAKLLPWAWHLVSLEGALLAIKGESAAVELAETKLKKGRVGVVREIQLNPLPLARVIEVRRSG
ncbi:MAG: 16S rRNA (guanine(527)-N(7))-methyltransferase RsmG [Actinomycetes bacterium]